MHTLNDDLNSASARNNNPDDVRSRQSKQAQINNLRDIPTNYHGQVNLGGPASQIANGSSNISFYNTPSPVAAQVCKSDYRSCKLLLSLRLECWWWLFAKVYLNYALVNLWLVEVADSFPCFHSFPSSSYQTFNRGFLFWCNNILCSVGFSFSVFFGVKEWILAYWWDGILWISISVSILCLQFIFFPLHIYHLVS